jgi:putative tryptophan/tyrosine transport system substrate-binding protein
MIKRRTFITLLGGAAAAWPLVARAQPTDRVRRIGFLWYLDSNDPAGKSWVAALMQGLTELGWVEGHNLRVDVRWDPKTAEQTRLFAEELIALHPDALVTGTPRLTLALQQRTKTIPIVFVGAADPLSSGLVPSLSHPGGNTTGVTDIFPELGGKWVELLKECVPSLRRVALVSNLDRALPGPTGPPSGSATSAIEAGRQYGINVTQMWVRNPDEIERAIPAFAAEPDGALIVRPLPGSQRKLIDGLAIRYGLPVLYQERGFAVEGGLLAYGTDFLYMFGHDAPPYIDRILRGEKPADLPVQLPTKFILTVNLTTAKAMGLKVPESFLARADELIE